MRGVIFWKLYGSDPVIVTPANIAWDTPKHYNDDYLKCSVQEPNIQRNHSIVLLVQFNPYIFNFPPKYFRLVNRRTSLYLQYIVPLLSY